MPRGPVLPNESTAMNETVERIQRLVDYAKTLKGDEKGEAQVFCDRLFQAFGHEGYKEAGATLDVCCVDLVRDRKGAIIVSPHQGEKDGPTQPYPTPRPDGRGPHGALLPHRRRLRPSQ